ncbi:MAG: murein L,D-transpeptidase family protein, partial [Pseudomonadota bacterium]
QTSSVLGLSKAEAPIPRDAIAFMRAEGMTPASPIMMRIFKEEAVLEVWKQAPTGRYELVKEYEICTYSGQKGPKHKEGDRQAPEGFYFVGKPQMNPRSAYHLAFNLGFPNRYDRSLGRTGSHLMVHGDCSSAGCYAMTDEYIEEIYAFAREALRGGKQSEFQVQAFPFRMTPENMAAHRDHKYFDYWKMLKQGYDHFELTKQPPKVDVCDRRYVFNVAPTDEGIRLNAVSQCPDLQMPRNLAMAYSELASKHALAFENAVARLEGRRGPVEQALKQSIIPAETLAIIEASIAAIPEPVVPEFVEPEVEPGAEPSVVDPIADEFQTTPATVQAPTPTPAVAPVSPTVVETTTVTTTPIAATTTPETVVSAGETPASPFPAAPAPPPAVVTTGPAVVQSN